MKVEPKASESIKSYAMRYNGADKYYPLFI